MKALIIIALAGLISVGCSRSIPASQAARHVGGKCTVEGYVASVHATGRGTVFMNFDNAYPSQTFTAVSLHGELSAADLAPFQHHTVSVSGTIEDYKGRPEIVLHALNQITLEK